MTARRPAAAWAQTSPDSWYNSHIWKKRARRQLKQAPLCEVCLDAGVVRAASIADHYPRWTNWAEFCYGPLRSVCHKHNMVGRFQYRGYRLEVDAQTGLPADRAHPFWRGEVG